VPESKRNATTEANQALNTPRKETDDEFCPITNASRDFEVAHFALGKMDRAQLAIDSP
jgi:hypothetical protein